jgi:hypothetical protein
MQSSIEKAPMIEGAGIVNADRGFGSVWAIRFVGASL